MLRERDAKVIAEPIVSSIVNFISKGDYISILNYVVNPLEDIESIKDWVNSFLDMNALEGIDPYGVECKFCPNNEYHQLECYIFDDGSGFAIDYDLTTDGEINDLTLQLDFKKKNDGLFEVNITGIDVL